jgi:copper(I)-binding protein
MAPTVDYPLTERNETMRLIKLIIVLLPFLMPVLVQADDYKLDALSIDHPWARATAPGAPVGGGYMSIRNTGDKPDRLVGGSVTFANSLEIHESSMVEGMMRMQRLDDGLLVPAGGTVVLKPGSFHLMFNGLQRRLVEGDSETVTLEFERAGTIELEFSVKGPGEMGPDQDGEAMDHGSMMHE